MNRRVHNPSPKWIYVFFFLFLYLFIYLFIHLFAKSLASHSESSWMKFVLISIITIIIQIQAVRRSLFISNSVLGETRRETQIIKAYVNHALLTPNPCAANLEVFKISIHLSWSRPKQSDQILKAQPLFSTVHLNYTVFSKSSNSQDISSGYENIIYTQFTPTAVQPHFLYGGL